MSAYIVTYDLMKQGQNYDCIIEKLKAYKGWHMQQSVWIVVSEQTHTEIRDSLVSCLDANDKLFVGRLNAAAWKSMGKEADKWLVGIIK